MAAPVSKHRGKFKSNTPEGTGIFQIGLRIVDPDNSNDTHFGALGTGFFVSKWGLFLTAAHVFDDDDLKLQGGKGLEAWIHIDDKIVPCPITDITIHPSADIAFGRIIEPRTRTGEKIPGFGISLVSISPTQSEVGSEVISYGYPRTELAHDEIDPTTVNINLFPDYYAGEILEYHPHGVSLCKWPVYRHSVATASGMSGGPLMNKTSKSAIGINCTGDSTKDEDIDHGMATDVWLALDIKLKSSVPALDGKTLREILSEES